MAFLLGIDTGGTFTDAVILKTASDGTGGKLVAKAKALTTKHDLAIGIAEAANSAIEQCQCDPKSIGLVSLSTTLATNALVERQGGRVALISIGFEEGDLQNAGLAQALGNDPIVLLNGGHTTHGKEAKPLDMEPLKQQLDELSATVSGFAVAGYFAVRNPEHELAVRDFILKHSGKAVTCSHELSAKLNGPKRALTTVLNARLVPLITRLISATRRSLEASGITAPLMVVRGDGALVSADYAMRRPIETILSGPAASLVGAKFLTGESHAFINDIGGTTSDVALLDGGKPILDPDGAMVGGYRTMVEAVAMRTFGLGGDSEVGLEEAGLTPKLLLGPKRLVPVALIAHTHGAVVHNILDSQLKNRLSNRYDGYFSFHSGVETKTGLSAREAKLFEKLSDVPQSVGDLLDGSAEAAALDTLVSRGLVQIAGLTPSDALHALDQHKLWDRDAALKALRLFGRRRDGGGKPIYDDPLVLAAKIIQRVQHRSAEIVLETAFEIDGLDGQAETRHPLIQNILKGREAAGKDVSKVNLALNLDRPLIGLGASAHAYHPRAAELLGINAIIPKDADVANAIGAVVGQVSMRVDIIISQPNQGRFQVAGIEKPFQQEKAAQQAAEKLAREKVQILAKQAGADEIEINISCTEKRAQIEGRDMLIETTVSALATGRPPIAN